VKGKLEGKVAIITGASAGIGQASARALAREGAKLVLSARRQERLDSLIAETRSLGGDGVAIIGDAREEDTAIRAVEAAKKLGGVHILINNVGVGNYKNLVDTSLADYVEMMDANVRTSFLFTRHAVPTMIAQRDGLILMISSMAGVYGFPGEAVYCATKFAQVGLAQGLDKELREYGIKVGTINPGGVKTEFAIGKGRSVDGVDKSSMLEAEDVAAAVHFACIQPKGSRIIQIQMRTMSESLT
jgi:NADP-dependent 3-hydroxy acid dehydrogenase YdfG